MNKTLIIIPTLNENKNVTIIHQQICKYQKKVDVLFVDDNSKDGTKKEIENLKIKSKKIFYIFRKNKKGIGSAHKSGIKWGYKRNYRYICTMDCDGTHHPRDLNKMLKKIENCDLVNTNRFLRKRSLLNWDVHRVFITKTRYFLINLLLNTKLDSSGAFRLYDTKKIKLDDIFLAKDNHYNFFWESLFYLEKKYKIKEIPVTLPTRALGSSKMKFQDLFFGLLYLVKIYLKDSYINKN